MKQLFRSGDTGTAHRRSAYGGNLRRLIIPGLVGGVLTLLYLWRRNLVSCMLMHAIVDGIVVVVIPAAMQARPV